MKTYFVIILIIASSLMSCNERINNSKVIPKTIKENNTNIVDKELYIKLNKFIQENPFDYPDEQIYLINLCLSENKDTLVFFHKTFYTDYYFTGIDLLERKGWFYFNGNIPVIIYDYRKNPLGRKLYFQDSLLDTLIDKKKTKRHTNLQKFIRIQEYKINHNKLIISDKKNVRKLGAKIYRCYEKQIESHPIIKEVEK
jgi:hypothetical protein